MRKRKKIRQNNDHIHKEPINLKTNYLYIEGFTEKAMASHSSTLA